MAATRLPCLVLCALLPQAAQAALYQVGPGHPYATLNALFDHPATDLQPGDVVEVDWRAEPYPGDVILRADNGGAPGQRVLIRGLRGPQGQRPHLQGGTNTVEFRLANHVQFEGFELSGSGNTLSGTFRCFFHHSHDVVLRDVLIRDCPRHGILGADNDSGSLTVEYSEIRNAGSNVGQHAIYMATDEIAYPGSVFRLQYSLVHDSRFDDSRDGGNLIKSRAERNEIYYNWLEGAFYHELELIGPDPAGGVPENRAREDSDVVGNVIVHTSDFGAIMRFGGDATGQSHGRYRFVNNTVVRLGGAGSTTVFRLFDGIESLEAHNNVFWRDSAGGLRMFRRDIVSPGVIGDPVQGGSHNWIRSGTTDVPAGWIQSVPGTAPGFMDVAMLDLRPAPDSPLLDAASGSPQALPGLPFPTPEFPPRYHPPLRILPPTGSAMLRPAAGQLDIGAFERAVPMELFADGFEASAPLANHRTPLR